MAYLIEPTNDLRESWLAAQREHHEVDGRTEAGGQEIDDLESGDSIDPIVQSLLAGTAVPGTDPGMTCEWWWVEPNGVWLEYIGRLVLVPNPGPREGHLRVAIRPSRRREGHGSRLLAAGLPIAAARGLLSVILACPRDDEAANKLVGRFDAAPLAHGGGRGVARFIVETMCAAR